ncbi:MAG: PcfJ domain-containing protein [Neomegalonema sp.]|nr:PcfJ domain-containing protein [Neomegalonema sp.]
MPIETNKNAAARAAGRTELDVGRLGRPPVEPQIKRFAKDARRRLRKAVRGNARFGDLLFSFPGAAYAIAVGGPGETARAEGVKAVKDGAPLQKVAEALGLPFWYRRLPPEAFRGSIETPKDDGNLARMAVNRIPENVGAAADWLEAIIITSRLADERVAGWIAKLPIWKNESALARAAILPVAAYAWHSQNADCRGRKAMDRYWSKNMSFRTAASEARVWLEKVITRFCLEEETSMRGWRMTQKSSGFNIVPLTTAEDLIREGERMNNCIATYQNYMERGGCLLYAVRRGSQSVASLEIRSDLREPSKGRVAQLEGRSNTAASDRVVRAVQKWLERQGPCPLAKGGGLVGRPVNARRWSALWSEFVDAVGVEEAGPFAEPPTEAGLRTLAGPLTALEEI